MIIQLGIFLKFKFLLTFYYENLHTCTHTHKVQRKSESICPFSRSIIYQYSAILLYLHLFYFFRIFRDNWCFKFQNVCSSKVRSCGQSNPCIVPHCHQGPRFLLSFCPDTLRLQDNPHDGKMAAVPVGITSPFHARRRFGLKGTC